MWASTQGCNAPQTAGIAEAGLCAAAHTHSYSTLDVEAPLPVCHLIPLVSRREGGWGAEEPKGLKHVTPAERVW